MADLPVSAIDARTAQRSLMGPLVALLVGSGARVSELLALRWSDVSIDGQSASVAIRRETTKTAAGARVVVIEPEYAGILRRHLLASGRPGPEVPVFVREDGRALDRHGRARSGLRRVAAAAGLDPEQVGFRVAPHVLRHSSGTWLEAAGERTANIAARLGHSDAAFTARRYVHPDRDGGAVTAARLAAMREARRADGATGRREPGPDRREQPFATAAPPRSR